MASKEIVLFKESGHNGSNGFIKFFYNNQTYRVCFQEIPKNLTDARAAKYHTYDIAKRTEPLLIYQSTDFRKVTLGMKFGALASGAQDAYDMMALTSLLRRSVYPTKRGIPMYNKLYLGPWFVNFGISPSGDNASGYILEIDQYTEDQDGMNCIINDYGLTPSEERLEDTESFKAISSQPSNWYEKFPAFIEVRLNITVFAESIWSGGSVVIAGTGAEASSEMPNSTETRASAKTDSKNTDVSDNSNSDVKNPISKAPENIPVSNVVGGGATTTEADANAYKVRSAEEQAKENAKKFGSPSRVF